MVGLVNKAACLATKHRSAYLDVIYSHVPRYMFANCHTTSESSTKFMQLAAQIALVGSNFAAFKILL